MVNPALQQTQQSDITKTMINNARATTQTSPRRHQSLARNKIWRVWWEAFCWWEAWGPGLLYHPPPRRCDSKIGLAV